MGKEKEEWGPRDRNRLKGLKDDKERHPGSGPGDNITPVKHCVDVDFN